MTAQQALSQLESSDQWIKYLENKMEFDFEIERETRVVIEPDDDENYHWENHVIDTYDASGRARIRLKNGSPRFSIKVPLFSKDTAKSKACLRMEFKPINDNQKELLRKIRDLILEEEGAQIIEKWGAKIKINDAEHIWINRDNQNRWWIEVDEIEEFIPPQHIKVIRFEKSSVKV